MNIHDGRRHTRRLVVLAAIASLAFAFGTSAAVAAAPGDKKDNDKKPDVRKEYALIFGTVWNAQQRPVYGVRVKIRRADEKKAKWELTSNHSGEFAQRVPAGTADYVVWAELPKHKGPAAETKVHIDNDERTDIGLHLTE
jgi:hypothetical protein